MRVCAAPNCQWPAERGSAWCYFHSKVAAGLITNAGVNHPGNKLAPLSWTPDGVSNDPETSSLDLALAHLLDETAESV